MLTEKQETTNGKSGSRSIVKGTVSRDKYNCFIRIAQAEKKQLFLWTVLKKESIEQQKKILPSPGKDLNI